MILECVITYECDLCSETFTVQNASEEYIFADAWYEGLNVVFCPDCKETETAQARIESERAAIAGAQASSPVEEKSTTGTVAAPKIKYHEEESE